MTGGTTTASPKAAKGGTTTTASPKAAKGASPKAAKGATGGTKAPKGERYCAYIAFGIRLTYLICIHMHHKRCLHSTYSAIIIHSPDLLPLINQQPSQWQRGSAKPAGPEPNADWYLC